MNKKFLQQLKDKENINVYIISVILITVFSLLLGSHIYEENRVLFNPISKTFCIIVVSGFVNT